MQNFGQIPIYLKKSLQQLPQQEEEKVPGEVTVKGQQSQHVPRKERLRSRPSGNKEIEVETNKHRQNYQQFILKRCDAIGFTAPLDRAGKTIGKYFVFETG